MYDQGDPCCHTSVRRVSSGVLLRNSRLLPGSPSQIAFCLRVFVVSRAPSRASQEHAAVCRLTALLLLTWED